LPYQGSGEKQMKHPKFVSLIVLLLVFSSVAGAYWAISATHEQNDQQPNNTMPQLDIQEKIRDAAMEYIKVNHAEVALFMDKLEWTGGRVTPEGLLGAETYTYSSSGWLVTLNYPVVANPVYKITVSYSVPNEEGSISLPYAIQWEGCWLNNSIREISYCFAQ